MLKRSLLIPFLGAILILLSSCSGTGGSSSSSYGSVIPAAPSGLHAVVTGVKEITLSWNAATGAISYNLYWKLSTDTTWSIQQVNGTVFVHAPLIQTKTYQYAVSALNSEGESTTTSSLDVLLDTPLTPSSIVAASGDSKVTVSWLPVPGAMSYNLYWSAASPVTKATATLIAGAVSACDIVGLSNETQYYFAVSAINAWGEGAESVEASATPKVLAGNTITVNGKITYEDREYDGSGAGNAGSGYFTGKTAFKAIRHADIEIYSAATASAPETLLASGLTDSQGGYRLSVTLPALKSYMFIRVISSATLAATSIVDIRDLSGTTLYAVKSAPFPALGDTQANIAIPVTNEAAGAFNILDVLTTGVEFVRELSGLYPPLLNAYWSIGQTPSQGTAYLQGGGIEINGGFADGSGDTDQFDDDVLWHEFGHFLAYVYSQDQSPGGYHTLLEHDQDMRLSWSEGWGDFMPLAVKYWLASGPHAIRLSTPAGQAASMYVDTSESGWSFNFDTVNAEAVYSTCETAVAKVLYNLMTGPKALDMQSLWNIFGGYMATAPAPINFETFWDGLRSLYASSIANSTDVLVERQIFFLEDAFESDNGFIRGALMPLGIPETHYLYSATITNDIDITPFAAVSGTSYTAQTFAIKNGADTYLRVVKPDKKTVVATNDDNGALPTTANNCDASGVCPWASRATFIADTTGIYYIEVTTSPLVGAGSGRYGTYSLSVNSP